MEQYDRCGGRHRSARNNRIRPSFNISTASYIETVSAEARRGVEVEKKLRRIAQNEEFVCTRRIRSFAPNAFISVELFRLQIDYSALCSSREMPIVPGGIKFGYRYPLSSGFPSTH